MSLIRCHNKYRNKNLKNNRKYHKRSKNNGLNNYTENWIWWYMLVILAVGRLRQEDHEFKVSMDI
jgi:hypothetical protein